MEKIVIDPALRQQLRDLKGYTLLCDQEGNALGIYQPVHQPIKAEAMILESPLSPAEIERRRQIKTGVTTEEMLQRLGL